MLRMTPAPSLRRLEIVVTTKMTVTTWSDSQLIYSNPLGDGALGIPPFAFIQTIPPFPSMLFLKCLSGGFIPALLD